MKEKFIHIGELIKKVMKERGISNAELARRISMSPASIPSMFKREDICAKLLIKISKALNYNFIGVLKEEIDNSNGSYMDLTIRIKLTDDELKQLKNKNVITKDIHINNV